MAESPKSFGQYRLIEQLGKGAMGTVFLAEDTMLQRRVALKVLPPDHTRDAQFLARFQREARAMGQLNHPNIAGAYAVGEDHGLHYYVMEYCPGEPFDRLLKRDGRMPWRTVVELAVQTAEGLAYAHEHGFVHRDIKPGNLILTPEKTVKILDLGLSKRLDEGQESNFATMAGQALGTPHYMAPEQVRGAKDADGRCDIYALGATLYHLLTGRTMFQGPTSAVIMAQHLSETPEDPRRLVPDLPEPLARVLRKATAREPDERYGDCRALLSDLQALLTGPAVGLARSRGSRTTGPREQVPAPTPRTGRTTRQAPPIERRSGERSWSTRAPRRDRKSPIAWVLLLLLAGIGTGAWFVFKPGSTPVGPPGDGPKPPETRTTANNGPAPGKEKVTKSVPPTPPLKTRVTRGLIAEYRFADGPGTSSVEHVTLDRAQTNDARIEKDRGFVVNGKRSAARDDRGGRQIIAAIRKSGRFTLDVWATPANLTQAGPARIVTLSCGTSSKQVNLHLGQQAANLSFRLRTSKEEFSQKYIVKPFGALGRPYHIALTDDGRMKRGYVDGKLKEEWPSLGDFSTWDGEYHLVFANEHTMDRQWHGVIHSVAFYSEALTPDEVRHNAKARPDGAPAGGEDEF